MGNVKYRHEKCMHRFGLETLPEKSLGTPRRKYEVNIKMEIKETGRLSLD